MKYSHKLSDAVHILAFVAINPANDLSSAVIASSVQSNASQIRRLMSQLVKAGLLTSQPGKVAVSLGRDAREITLFDVYAAVEDYRHLIHVDEDTNPLCPVGGNIQDVLNGVYADVQAQAEAAMRQTNLQQIIDALVAAQKAKIQEP
ncbi:Rrf2 family transcriptional regulator [Lacticaseibacillus sharpeae]|uniref:Transcriptional regulator n=1 Tax=Lacticaseibacillus sharpeae JCM 1186 = DSM 20505 TaxID=1291052 RepID=A0A0R1ZKX6_9LACO|nr:Rrf2 family transcriptional regulator [Lacticaseibacillus sharpeae]KRM55167.1 hypothetical protein FC18_GL001617 [Lacticaseibacillus sharpeae JCM 1186 = DSM 20505]